MSSEELYLKLRSYFSNNHDLMRHLKPDACWEYKIAKSSINEEDTILIFYLRKIDEKSLDMTKTAPLTKPDLILYFTQNAILNLIEENPSAEEYYSRYRKIMNNPRAGIELDSKINKPRFKLLKLGYRSWQKDFKF